MTWVSPLLIRKASSKERDICSLREVKKVWAVLIS